MAATSTPNSPAAAPASWTATAGTVLSRIVVPGWLLAGAAFKLAERDPRLLPKPVMDTLDLLLNQGLGYGKEAYLAPSLRAIVAVEIALALTMVFAPKLARFLGIATLALFCVILAVLLAGGSAACGCFGKSGPPPAVMLALDGALLAGLIFLKPRATTQSLGAAVGIGAGTLLLGAAVAFSVPERQEIALPTTPDQTTAPTPPAPPPPPVDPPSTTPPATNPPATNPPPTDPPPTNPPPVATATPWPPSPATAKPWYAPEFEKWIGQRLDAQEFALLITRPLPLNPNEGLLHIVFIREDCEHCHQLLNQYFSGTLAVPTLAVVVPDATGEPLENPCTECKKATLPAGGITWVLSTPVLLTVENGIVVGVCTDADNPEKVRAALNARSKANPK
ncbi:MAG: hypothetical protein U0625_10460 [Phycisphaerales bacterium]